MLTDADVVGGSLAEARYDRQIRLWGRQAQQALRGAHVVALGATAAVSEALKSIILTGVRAVTIVDERAVTGDDLACNYFLTMEDLGGSLAERVAAHLGELNTDCAMFAVSDCSPDAWSSSLVACVCLPPGAATTDEAVGEAAERSIVRDLAALLSRSRPIPSSALEAAAPHSGDSVHGKTPMTPGLPSLLLLSNRCTDLSPSSPLARAAVQGLNTPMVVVESRGLTGYLQTYARDRLMVTPQPVIEEPVEDLRTFEPFPELAAWFAAHDPADLSLFPLNDLDRLRALSRLPYINILHHAYVRYVEKRRAEAEAAARTDAVGPTHPIEVVAWPLRRADYEAIKAEVRAMERPDQPEQPEPEGFQEALLMCDTRLNRPLTLTRSVRALFEDPRCTCPASTVHDVGGACSSGSAGEPVLRVTPPVDSAYVLSWYMAYAVRQFYMASVADDGASSCVCDSREEEAAADKRLPRLPTHERHRVLPFCGHVPDMTTTTQWFQELRAIYQRKHEADVAAVVAAFRHKLTEDLADVGSPRLAVWAAALKDEEVQQMAKDLVANVWFACAVRFSPGFTAAEASRRCGSGGWQAVVRDRLQAALRRFVEMDTAFEVSSKRACGVGMALLAAHEQRRVAGAAGVQCGSPPLGPHASWESGQLFPFLMDLLTGSGGGASAAEEEDDDGGDVSPPVEMSDVDRELLRKLSWEVERVGLSEVPFVAAVIGALAAQEVIKLVQHRGVPLTYPMVYSGIDGVYFNLPAAPATKSKPAIMFPPTHLDHVRTAAKVRE